MMRWSISEGASVFRGPAGYTNGNYRDRQGRLVSCERGNRRISRTEPDGSVLTLMDRYDGNRLNSPNDFVIDNPYASSRHALIKVGSANVTVFDLGSAGGVKVNETVLTGRPVNPGSTISVGDTRMQVLQVDSPDQFASVVNADETIVDLKSKKTVALVAIAGPAAGKSYMISEGDNVIGRNAACQVALSDKAVSRKHALIRFEGSNLTAFNLGSNTTTEVDGMKLVGLNVSNGDLLTIGKTVLTFVQAKS